MSKIKKMPVWLSKEKYGEVVKMLREQKIDFWVEGQVFFLHKQTFVLTSMVWAAILMAALFLA